MDKILMLYYPLLDPVMKNPDEVLELYERYGCRIIEVALPCENPVLDGPAVRDSMERILKKASLTDMFAAIKGVKERHPGLRIQIMSYIETVENMGYKAFADSCRSSLVDYVLTPDASADQLDMLDQTFAKLYDIPVIRFLPAADCGGLLKKANGARGYLFLQSGSGKSGGCQEIGDGLKDRIECLRQNNIDLPVIVGFGIRNYEQIKACHQSGADGVTIGSAMLDTIVLTETESYLSLLTGKTDPKRKVPLTCVRRKDKTRKEVPI